MSVEYATPKERAVAALSEFQKLVPTLAGYARAFTGIRTMRVIPAVGEPRTDGRNIYMQPPLELADKTKHDKSKCGKWDWEGLQQCLACMIRHDLLWSAFHEIGHVTEGSVDPLTEQDKTWVAMQAAVTLGENPRTRGLAEHIEKVAKRNRGNWLAVASGVSPFMPTLYNAFEDGRINHKIGVAKPGARRMRISSEIRHYREGVKAFDPFTGEPIQKHYIEMELNHQMMVALYFASVGNDIPDGLFETEVMDALADQRVIEICDRTRSDLSKRTPFLNALEVFAILRESGFFLHATDEFVEPPPPPPPPPMTAEPDEDDGDPEPDEDDTESDASLNMDPEEGEDDDESTPDEVDDDELKEGKGSLDEDEDELDPEGGEEDDDAPEDRTEHRAGEAEDEDEAGGEDSSGEDPLEAGDRDELDNDRLDLEARDGESSQPVEDDSDLEDEGEDEDWEDWTPAPSSDFDPGNDPEEEGDADPASPGGEVDLGDDSDEYGPDEREPSSDSTDSEQGDPSDVEDERTDGSEDESEYEEDDSPLPDWDDEPGEGGSESGGTDEGDADQEHEDSGDGERQNESGDDSEGGAGEAGSGGVDSDDEGEGDGIDDNALNSATENVSEHDRLNGADDDEEDGSDGATGQDGAEDERDWGTEEGADNALQELLGHGHQHDDEEDEGRIPDKEAAQLMGEALAGSYFDNTPRNIGGLRLHREGDHQTVNGADYASGWTHAYEGYFSKLSRRDWGIDPEEGGTFSAPEAVIGSSLLHARLAFAANRRSASQHNLKSGKVDRRVLGKRAPHGDERLFYKKQIPKKRDYFVLIGFDISGSTLGDRIRIMKKCVMAEAEVLHRLGVSFAIYAHSGKDDPNGTVGLDIYEIKADGEPWNDTTRTRLTEIGPDSSNLDGHTLEYYRKVLDGRRETDRILQYYTDGAMPAENYTEELEVMQRNIEICKHRGYHLMAVGVTTDSPAAHGFDTVRVNSVEDVSKVVQHLGRRLQS
jgi:cobalamin biosynthesis protein CobT